MLQASGGQVKAGLLVTRAQLELATGEFQAALKTTGRLLAGPQAGIHYQYRFNCIPVLECSV